MRIGIFTESFLPQVNGVVTAICNSARLLSKDHEISIFTVGEGPAQYSGIPVIRFKGMKLPTYPEYRFFVPSRGTLDKLGRISLDIIHVRSSVGFSLAALRAAKRLNIPVVGTFDTPLSDYVHYVPVLGRVDPLRRVLSRLSLKYMAWMYNRCDMVIAPSEVTRKWLESIGCKSRIKVISNGVDTSLFRPGKRSAGLRKRLLKGRKLLLLHVGRITREKRIDTLLDAARGLKGKGLDFRLVVAGKGPELQRLHRAAKELGLDDHVGFIGFVPDNELPTLYASSDVFVTASPVETEGIVLLEAMASGLPVIGADAGAIPEIVNSRNGLLFRAGDSGGLVGKILLIAGRNPRKAMSASARKHSESYSIAKTVKRLDSVYRRLAKN